MRRRLPPPQAGVLVALLVAFPLVARGQATGKLSGRVTDETTATPVIGASVVVLGTARGAATDADGRFVLVGLPPDSYDLRISFIGYAAKVVRGVRVFSDRTRRLDVTISPAVLGADEVLVQASHEVVNPMRTASRQLITGEEIRGLPVTTLQDVISRTSNAYDGYIRGSRRFETKTVLEGIDISDTFYAVTPFALGLEGVTNKADQTSPSVFNLAANGISEVAVVSGATEPSYASGTGGVVTVSLKEERGPIRGAIAARISPQVNRPGPDSLDFYHEHVRVADADGEEFDLDGDGFVSTGEAYLEAKSVLGRLAAEGDQEAIARLKLFTWYPDKYQAGGRPDINLSANLGGSLRDNLHFFLIARYDQSHGFMPNQFDASLNAQLKATIELSDKSAVTAVGLFHDEGFFLKQWKNRDYDDLFRFKLESVAQNESGSYLGSLRWRRMLGDDSFLAVQAYRIYDRDRRGYPDDDGDGFSELGEDGDFIDFADPLVIQRYIDASEPRPEKMFMSAPTVFTRSGVRLGRTDYPAGLPEPYSEDTRVTTNGGRLDYANQMTPNHFVQLGSEIKRRSIAYEQVLGSGYAALYGSPQQEGTCDTEDGSCRFREPYTPNRYERKPWEIDFYVSDRMEYSGLIVNLGARVEIVDSDLEEITDYYFPLQQVGVVASDFWGRSVAGNDTLTRNVFRRGQDVGVDVFFNPSVGVAHPIGSNAAVYFSFRRTKQSQPYARLYYRYGGLHGDAGGSGIADPNMDPIESETYELGAQWEFIKGWGVDVNAYAKAVDNFSVMALHARERIPEGREPVGNYGQYGYLTDFGYADARGVEVVLRSSRVALADGFDLGVVASYTFATVESAEATQSDVDTYISENDLDTKLPFDNVESFRHVPVNVKGGNSVIEKGFDRRHRGVLRLTAILAHEISLGLNASIESGFLYPPAIVDDERDRALATGPTNHSLDFRAAKGFSLGSYTVDLFLDVTNLTNARNVIAYDPGVENLDAIRFQQQGIPALTLILPDGSPVYGPARQVFFGARMRF